MDAHAGLADFHNVEMQSVRDILWVRTDTKIVWSGRGDKGTCTQDKRGKKEGEIVYAWLEGLSEMYDVPDKFWRGLI